MKKVFNQLKVTLSLIVVFTLLLGCGALTYREAKQVITDFRYKDNALGDLSDDIGDYYKYGEKISYDMESEGYKPDLKNGIGILPAFYLSHTENHYNVNNVGFYSMLRNSDWEIVAKYQPYIIFEKNIYDKTRSDVRVLILGDEFAEAYYTGKIETDLKYDIDACDVLEKTIAYGLGNNTDLAYDFGNENIRGMDIDGTCDDSLIYLEKLTWYQSVHSDKQIFTYSPKEKQTVEGSVNFEDWLDYKNNHADMGISNDIRYISYSTPEYRDEAKEICEQNLISYKNNQLLGDNFSENLFTTTTSKTGIIHDKNSDDYYIFTAAYVIHPLNDAVQSLMPVYLIAFVIGTVLIIFINILLNKKRKFLESSFVLKKKTPLLKEG